MGKRIIQQKRGRGSIRYRSPSHRSKGQIKYMAVNDSLLTGKIVDFIHSPMHTAPLAKVTYDNGKNVLVFACEKMAVGDVVEFGAKAVPERGCVIPLGNIPEGSLVYNLEKLPGDGGKFVRSSGTFARIVSKTESGVLVKMPSKKIKKFNTNCRATLGVVAGGGRTEKPFVKAGKKWHAARATGKLYPHTSAVAMNANNHPFGSGRGRHIGKCKTPPRNAPPGRKVGQVAARRTGKK